MLSLSSPWPTLRGGSKDNNKNEEWEDTYSKSKKTKYQVLAAPGMEELQI